MLDRMIPDLQASFACEDVRVEASGAHTIVGIVNFIGAPTLPIQVIKLCVWTRWSSGVGQFEQVTRLVAPGRGNRARHGHDAVPPRQRGEPHHQREYFRRPPVQARPARITSRSCSTAK